MSTLDETAVVSAFLVRVLDDRRDGIERALDEYLADYPGYEAAIERAYRNLDATQPAVSDAPQSEQFHLGDFSVVREIGRGGMGVVYEATQMSLGRRVAVKVLPPHLTSDVEKLGRFRREAAAAGQIRHPGIVPIYTVAESDGVHYYAMEYIDGFGLDELVERQRSDVIGVPVEPTGTVKPAQPSWITEAAEIVAQAAEAAGAAHRQRVIHRDLKPQNIMIDGGGSVRVVDFGLARHLESAGFTRTGDVAGTPKYMSPEQAEGRTDLDCGTDVFSLGVVLYELLTLRCPFDGESGPQVMRAISTREAPSPRGINPRVPRDLETICGKALDKDIKHRYADGDELAADLRRFLAHEPIVAQPPGLATRFYKLVRRRKAAASAVAMAVLLVVVGPLVFGLFMAAEKAETERQRDRARANLARAREVVEAQLVSIRAMKGVPGLRSLYEEMTAQALKHYTDFLGQAEQEGYPDLELVRDMATTHALVGQLHGDLGDHVAAAESARRSVDYWQRLIAVDAGTDHRFGLAGALQWLARYEQRAGRDELADAAELATLAELAGLVDAGSSPAVVARARSQEAVIRGLRGLRLLRVGERREEAAVEIERALAIWPEIPAEFAEQFHNLQARVHMLSGCGKYFHETGRDEDAQARLEEAIGLCDLLVELNGNADVRLQRVDVLTNLVASLGRRGLNAEASNYNDATIEQLRDLITDFPRETQFRSMLAQSLTHWLMLPSDERSSAEAVEAVAAEAIQLMAELVAERSDNFDLRQRLSATHTTVAAAYSEMVPLDPELVDHHMVAAIAAIEPLVTAGNEYPETLAQLSASLSNRARFQLEQGEHEVARPLIERALEVLARAHAANPDHPDYRRFLRNQHWVLAQVLMKQGEHAGAAAAARRMVEWAGEDVPAHGFAAQAFANCVTLARDDLTLGESRDAVMARYADAAMECLAWAADHGWSSSTRIPANKHLRVLGDRDDFRQLLGRLRAAGR